LTAGRSKDSLKGRRPEIRLGQETENVCITISTEKETGTPGQKNLKSSDQGKKNVGGRGERERASRDQGRISQKQAGEGSHAKNFGKTKKDAVLKQGI